MSRSFRIAYFAHSIRSDWNNGNVHFLRGLLDKMGGLGHEITVFEHQDGWSINNLKTEKSGEHSMRQFAQMYPQLRIVEYESLDSTSLTTWRQTLRDTEIVIVHEWNTPELAHCLLKLRDDLGFQLLFHDTHHRASSSPEQIRSFCLHRFGGILAFGESLRQIYRTRFGISRVWTLHEAADTKMFYPRPALTKTADVVWIGNWGDGERSLELNEFLLQPAAKLARTDFVVYGVRYPEGAVHALDQSGIRYGGYLANLDAPAVYSSARLTMHIPRQQYAAAMHGIPTIRVFEALACGIPLVCAPWTDSERLFRDGDFITSRNSNEMQSAIHALLDNPAKAKAQALGGLETVLSRHTCEHRAEQLTSICEELFQ